MAINPNLVSIISASDLPTGDPTSAGQFFFFEGAEMKKAPMTNIYDKVTSGIKGIATPESSPTAWIEGDPRLFESWKVTQAGTYTNFEDIATTAIVVTEEDLAGNFVTIDVTNGVAKKTVLNVQQLPDSATLGISTITTSRNLFDKVNNILENKAIDESGNVITLESWATFKNFVPVKPLTLYDHTGASGGFVYYYDVNKVFIQSQGLPSISPENAAFAKANLLLAGKDEYMFTEGALPLEYSEYVEKTYLPNVVAAPQLPDDAVSGITKVVVSRNLFDKVNNTLENHVTDNSGNVTTQSGWGTFKNLVEIKPSVLYDQTAATGGYAIFFDENKDFAGYITLPGVSPSNAKYVKANFILSGKDEFMFVEGTLPTEYSPFIEKTYLPNLVTSSDKKTIESWGQLGDSWTFSNKWQPYVKDKFNIESSYNESLSGSFVCRVSGESIVPFIDRYQDLPDSDLITIMGGINDAAANAPIGTLGVLNETTFIGAYQTIIEWYLTRNPLCKIVIMCPSVFWDYAEPRPKNANIENFILATKQIADYYNLPVFDMNTVMGINEKTKNALMSDLVHLNDLGSKRLGILFSNFLDTIY